MHPSVHATLEIVKEGAWCGKDDAAFMSESSQSFSNWNLISWLFLLVMCCHVL